MMLSPPARSLCASAAGIQRQSLSQQTVAGRRQFLGSFLGALLFWRGNRPKLAGIQFERIRHGSAHRRYLLIHGNESTARQVLTEHMRHHEGTAYLILNPARNIPFQGGELDPNRMFSRRGAERSLRSLNPNWSAAQLERGLRYLDHHRHQLLNAVEPRGGDILIALHNNVEYSVNDEIASSDQVALNDRVNPHEFCLATSQPDYELLAAGAFNVVLQAQPRGDDDGSLSRYCARAGLRYINIECGMGKPDRQRLMLDWVESQLNSPGPSVQISVSSGTSETSPVLS